MTKKIDSIVQAIIERFKSRAEKGREKYGTDLDRTDLDVLDWIQHLQDELHDAYLYSEKLKKEYIKEKRLFELNRKRSQASLPEEEETEYAQLLLDYKKKSKNYATTPPQPPGPPSS